MKYPVFLQALALTIVVFLIGMYAGIALEDARMNDITDYQIESEVALIDILTLNDLIDVSDVSCEELYSANIDLLNRVYDEAVVLEEYEASERMTDKMKSLHKRYDVLRTYLWMNSIKIKEKCGDDYNTVVYLYNADEEDLTVKATQNVWSKVLLDVKNEREDVLLIPIARDTNLRSLESLMEDFEVESYPVVIVNEEVVFSELSNKEEIFSALN